MKLTLLSAGHCKFPLGDLVGYLKDYHQIQFMLMPDRQLKHPALPHVEIEPFSYEKLKQFDPDYVLLDMPPFNSDILEHPSCVEVGGACDFIHFVTEFVGLPLLRHAHRAVPVIFTSHLDECEDPRYGPAMYRVGVNHPITNFELYLSQVISSVHVSGLIVNVNEPYGPSPHPYSAIGSWMRRAASGQEMLRLREGSFLSPTYIQDVSRILAKLFARSGQRGFIEISCNAVIDSHDFLKLLGQRLGVTISDEESLFVPSNEFNGNRRLILEFNDVPRTTIERGIDIITS